MTTNSRGKYEFDGDVEAYDARYLMCRDIMHHWIPDPHWSATRTGKRIIEYRRTLVCQNCGAERRDKYDGRMRPVGRYYHYNDGYVTKKGTERIDSAAARLEQIRRAGLGEPASRRLRAV